MTSIFMHGMAGLKGSWSEWLVNVRSHAEKPSCLSEQQIATARHVREAVFQLDVAASMSTGETKRGPSQPNNRNLSNEN